MSDTEGVSITFELKLRPEAVDGFAAAAPEMIKGTAAFPGFRQIRIVQHKDEPGRFLFIERWDSEQAYRDYLAWRASEGAMDSLRQAAPLVPAGDATVIDTSTLDADAVFAAALAAIHGKLAVTKR